MGDADYVVKFFRLDVLLVFVMMFLSTIVFLNLLIAMMGKTYDSIDQEGLAEQKYWMVRLRIVRQYQRAPRYPPPFNVLEWVVSYVYQAAVSLKRHTRWSLKYFLHDLAVRQYAVVPVQHAVENLVSHCTDSMHQVEKTRNVKTIVTS